MERAPAQPALGHLDADRCEQGNELGAVVGISGGVKAPAAPVRTPRLAVGQVVPQEAIVSVLTVALSDHRAVRGCRPECWQFPRRGQGQDPSVAGEYNGMTRQPISA